MDIAMPQPQPDTQSAALSDSEVVRRVRAGEHALFEVLMRRHNQRVYRTVRAVLGPLGDPEEVMQQAYVNAYTHLHQFEERAQFSTWLTRIALNEALAERRRAGRHDVVPIEAQAEGSTGVVDALSTRGPDPERQAYSRELGTLLEDAIDSLPDTYRIVFMLRDVEGMSTRETGEGLQLGEEAVKTRLHRARALLRSRIADRMGAAAAESFQFHASRCDRVVAGVLARIHARSVGHHRETDRQYVP
jgi:RNA polymerase sigma-70 factor, ECF subfamily